MTRAIIIILLQLSVCIPFLTQAQRCLGTGRNPGDPIPICGYTTLNGSLPSVLNCTNGTFNSKCVPLAFTDTNPNWYSFTCYGSGSFGFTATPIDPGIPVSFTLFDITGLSPSAVYAGGNPDIIRACNFSSAGGMTGAVNGGSGLFICGGLTAPTLSSMPTLLAGHDYLLSIISRSPFTFTVEGGTANISPPPEPHLLNATAHCDGTKALITINKKLLGRTLSANGSEFIISPPLANVISAKSVAPVRDIDSIILKFDNPLPYGTYTISIKKGDDLNTITDDCNREIPVAESVTINVTPVNAIAMDSLIKPGCAPDRLKLVFSKGVNCNSIAANGTDFIVTGTSPVSVIGASAVCTDGISNSIEVRLAAPITTSGSFQVKLVSGSDGNTLIDECGKELAVGAVLNFNVSPKLNAGFNYQTKFGCRYDSIEYSATDQNATTWSWHFDQIGSSSLQNPVAIYTYASFGEQSTTLIVSNGVCSDTSSQQILLNNSYKAAFIATAAACPGDLIQFENNSTGNIISWLWNFNDNITSNEKIPLSRIFPTENTSYDIPVKLTVTTNLGCVDSAIQNIRIVNNCSILVPNSFSPNNDNMNDYLYPLNAYKAVNLSFCVYDRFGNLLFKTHDWTRKWDGKFKGQPVDAGTYVWTLHYTNKDTGKTVDQKGTTILIR